DLVEGILDETPEPAPEEPLHLWNDKKRDEDRSHKHANGSGNESIGDDHDCYGLGRGEQDGHNDEHGRSENVSPAGGVHSGFEVRNLRNHCLELGLIDLARQKLGLVGDEVVEAGSDAGNRCVVVVDHREAKADGQQQARKIIEMERMLAAGGGKSGFDAVPSDKNGSERTKQILAHSVEETEVLGKQGGDGLEDKLQIVSLHCRQLLRRLGVFLRTLKACGSFEVNW